MFPRAKELRVSKQQQEIILRDAVVAYCPLCKHETTIHTDDQVYCLQCFMRGAMVKIIPKSVNGYKRKRKHKNSKVITYNLRSEG